MSVEGETITSNSSVKAHISSDQKIDSRNLVAEHLDSTRGNGSGSQASASLSIKDGQNIIDQTRRNRDSARHTDTDQLNKDLQAEIAKQDQEIKTRIKESRAAVAAGRHKVAEIEARIEELNGSWNIFRHLSSEKDGLTKWLAREKEFLKSTEEQYKLIQQSAEKYNQTKVEISKLSVSSNPAVTQASIQQLKQKAQELLNIQIYNQIAVDVLSYKAANDKPQSALRMIASNTWNSFNQTQAGRVIVGSVTIVHEACRAVRDVAGDVITFVSKKENWARVGDWLDNAVDSTGEFLKKAGSLISKGFTATCNFLSEPSSWAKMGRILGESLLLSAKMPLSLLRLGVEGLFNPKAAWANFCNTIDKSISKIANEMGLSSVWEITKGILAKIQDKAGDLLDYLKKPENWKKLGTKILDGLEATVDFLSKPENWLKLAKGLGQAMFLSYKLPLAAMQLVVESLLDPKAAWSKFCKTVDESLSKLAKDVGLEGLYKFAKGAAGFVKDLADSLGLTNIVVGLVNIINLPMRAVVNGMQSIGTTCRLMMDFVSGKITLDQFKDAFKNTFKKYFSGLTDSITESFKAVTGVAQLLGELSGVSDLGRAIKCFMSGDMAMAGMYLGLSIGSLMTTAAVVLTAGAAIGGTAIVASIRSSIKNATLKAGKQCFAKIGPILGDNIASKFIKKKGIAFFEAQGAKVADKLVVECYKKGLSLNTVEAMAKQFGKNEKVFLKEAGLEKLIRKETRELLQGLMEDPKHMAKFMRKNIDGLGFIESRKMCKAAKRMLVSGKNFDEITEILSKDISDKVFKKIGPHLEKGFVNRFKATLEGKVHSEAGQSLAAKVEREALEKGLPKSKLIDEYVEKAAKGYREGLKEAIEEVAEAGVKKALKDLKIKKGRLKRMLKYMLHDTKPETSVVEAKKKPEVAVAKKAEATNKGYAPAVTKKSDAYKGHSDLRRKEVKEINGKRFVSELEQVDEGNWKVLAQSVSDIDSDLAAKKVNPITDKDNIVLYADKKKDAA